MLARTLSAIFLVLAVVAATVAIEDASKIHSNPAPPSREVLDRLNLRMPWRAFVPMDGRKDGFASIQFHDKFLVIQTRSGLITMLDAESGRTMWRTRVGLPYQPALPLAINYHGVYIANGTYIYALDRDTGTLLWSFSPPAGLSAPPVADDEQLYLSTVDNRLYAYRMQRNRPDAPAKSSTMTADADLTKRPVLPQDKYRSATPTLTYFTSVRQAGSDLGTGPKPVVNWDTVARVRLELAPVYSKLSLFVASPEDTYFAMDKGIEGKPGPIEVYRFHTDGPIGVPPAVYDETAYVGSRDANLYAVHIETGRTVWRYTAGTAITREPAVIEQDVFVTSQGGGLARIDRETGEPVWRIVRGDRILSAQADADRFLAANPKFVYAADRSRRLIVLDRRRGVELSRFDTRDYAFPISNVVTDRLYLAANNGLLVCLHDRDYTEPVRHRKQEERTQNPSAVLRDVLNRPINEKAGEQDQTIREMLRDLSKRYGIQIFIADKAFKAEKRESVSDRLAKFPRADNIPLKDVLKLILEPLEARFEVVGDTIQVLPAKPKPKAP